MPIKVTWWKIKWEVSIRKIKSDALVRRVASKIKKCGILVSDKVRGGTRTLWARRSGSAPGTWAGWWTSCAAARCRAWGWRRPSAAWPAPPAPWTGPPGCRAAASPFDSRPSQRTFAVNYIYFNLVTCYNASSKIIIKILENGILKFIIHNLMPATVWQAVIDDKMNVIL